MLDNDIKITRVMEDRRIGEHDRIAAIIRVEFRVGDHGPFVEHFPKELYSAAARDQKLNDFAREVRQA